MRLLVPLSLIAASATTNAFSTSNVKHASAFIPHNTKMSPLASSRPSSSSRKSSSSSMSMMMPMDDPTTLLSSAITSASMHLATIDSDIANISDDKFKEVFAGGIVVMFGGVFSALIVGFILEIGDNYDKVVSDSFAEGGEDDAFWGTLTPEQKAQAEEALQKLRDSKKKNGSEEPAAVVTEQEKKEKEEVSMFSDYDD